MGTSSTTQTGGFRAKNFTFSVLLMAMVMPLLLSIAFAAPTGNIHLRRDERVPEDATK